MILGHKPFTWLHTILSLIALVSGCVVLVGLLRSRTLPLWSALFLASAAATSATGFGFRTASFGASHWLGIISLVVFALAILARYVFRFAGAWRWIYALGMVSGLYFLVFVTIAQAFKKVPALEAMAPTLSEPAFTHAQLVTLGIFIVFAAVAARSFGRAGPLGRSSR